MTNYKKVLRTLVSLKDQLFAVFILADQSPARTEMRYYVDFLGQKTAFYNNMEKVARTLYYAVVYLNMNRVKRGFYEVQDIPITESANNTREEHIADKFIKLLRNSTRNLPTNWFWSNNQLKNTEEIAN